MWLWLQRMQSRPPWPRASNRWGNGLGQTLVRGWGLFLSGSLWSLAWKTFTQPAQLPVSMFSVCLRDWFLRMEESGCETAEGNRWQNWNSSFPHPSARQSLSLTSSPPASLPPAFHYFSFSVNFFSSFFVSCPFSSFSLTCAPSQTHAQSLAHSHTLPKADAVFFRIFINLSGAGDSGPQGWIPEIAPTFHLERKMKKIPTKIQFNQLNESSWLQRWPLGYLMVFRSFRSLKGLSLKSEDQKIGQNVKTRR